MTRLKAVSVANPFICFVAIGCHPYNLSIVDVRGGELDSSITDLRGRTQWTSVASLRDYRLGLLL